MNTVLVQPAQKRNLTVLLIKKNKRNECKGILKNIKSQKQQSKGTLKIYYSEQPGQFLKLLLIGPDLRLRVPNCIYEIQRNRLPRFRQLPVKPLANRHMSRLEKRVTHV